MPAIVPNIKGLCASSPSKNHPITHVPGTIPTGVCPKPEVAADVIDCKGIAHGKSDVGSKFVSAV